MKITAIIEKSKEDGSFSVYSDDKVSNQFFGGFGDNVAEAKEDFEQCVQEVKEEVAAEGIHDLDDYQIEWKYDIASFFNYFDWINMSKFAKKVGINDSQMRQYKSGAAFASESTTSKILAAIKTLGAELSAASI